MLIKQVIAVLFCIGIVLSCSGNETGKDQSSLSEQVSFVELPDDRMPVTYLSVVIKSGSADDPAGQEGLAWMCSNYLERGTKSFDKAQIQNKIADLGGRLDIRVDREVIQISGKVLSDKLEDFYAIFREIILNPTFSSTELKSIKAEQEHALNQIIRNDSRLSLATLQYYLYSGHPYAHPVEGLFTSIDKLTPEDARSFYQTHFKSGNILCGLAGEYPDDFERKFIDDMNSLAGKNAETDRFVPNGYDKRNVIIVQKPGRDQSQIRIGRLLSYNRTDPVWYPLQIANSYLGRHRESFGRLFITIRDLRGLSYGAYSYHENFKQAGWSNNPLPLVPFDPQYFSIWTYPRRINTEFALKMAIYELDKLLTAGIDPIKMETIKNYEINHFPFLIETAEQKLNMALQELYYNQHDFVAGYDERITKQTSADVNTALHDYWSADDLLIIIVTSDGEDMKSQLLTQQTELELPGGATETGLEEINNLVKSYDLGLSPEDIVIIDADKLFR